MGRLGHNAKLWLALGALSGPASVALVAQAIRDRDLLEPDRLKGGGSGPGPVDVLVGVDGSPESHSALTAALDLLSDRIGRLTIAVVADYDSGFPGGPDRPRDEAEEELAAARSMAAARGFDPELILLFGPPAVTLEDHARDHGFELLVIGRRGRGLATTAFGSVATHLARTAAVPILISS